MKKFVPLFICLLLTASSASAEIKTYEGVGEYVMSDFETPDVAKLRAKQRAEASAQEQAGVFIRSNTKVINSQVESEEIEVMTAGIMKIRSVTYDVKPDTAGFVFTSKVVADIDTDEIDKWLEMNKDTKAELLEQNKSLQASLAAQEKQLAELKAKLALAEKNQTLETQPAIRIEIARNFAQSNTIFLSDDRLDAGIKAHQRGDLQGAINAYTEAIALNAKNVSALTWRGNAYGSLGNYQQAIADFINALQINNQNPTACIGLGIAYYSIRYYENAISALNAAIRLDGKNGKAYFVRANCYNAVGNKFAAMQDFSMARALNYNGE